MILWPESFLGLVQPPQQEETPIYMTQHGRRLLTSTVMADKVGSPHARTKGTAPVQLFKNHIIPSRIYPTTPEDASDRAESSH